MAGPTEGPVRLPAVAGMFYPDDPEQCRETARRYVQSAPRREDIDSRGGPWIGGIVPHAGWICSAAIAAETIASIARSATAAATATGAGPIDVVVVFGAVHTPLPLEQAVLDSLDRKSTRLNSSHSSPSRMPSSA